MRMIAVMTNGAFLPVPYFLNRVTNDLNNAGLTLTNVVTSDTGNYTVVVSGREGSGSFFQHRRTNVLQVGSLTYQRVSFHAHGLRNIHPHNESALIVDSVVINQGQGYNGDTGIFTAPLNGTYFFTGTMGSLTNTHNPGQFSLIVDGQVIASVSIRTSGPVEAVSVHGIVHLRLGQQVWLSVNSNVMFSSAATSFSGYLISVDP
ncbi:hypothetical protein ACOMHN_042022 [Nucella lapillus]